MSLLLYLGLAPVLVPLLQRYAWDQSSSGGYVWIEFIELSIFLNWRTPLNEVRDPSRLQEGVVLHVLVLVPHRLRTLPFSLLIQPQSLQVAQVVPYQLHPNWLYVPSQQVRFVGALQR